MTDILLYWRDYRQTWTPQFTGERVLYWHSSARLFKGLTAGDRLWLVTSGKNLNGVSRGTPQAGFLVGAWQVKHVVLNPGDDPAYPREDYRYRIVADASASMLLDAPVLVDQILRPAGRDKAVSIGRFLQGPRKLNDDRVRLLRAAAGPAMAKHYLTGRQL